MHVQVCMRARVRARCNVYLCAIFFIHKAYGNLFNLIHFIAMAQAAGYRAQLAVQLGR